VRVPARPQRGFPDRSGLAPVSLSSSFRWLRCYIVKKASKKAGLNGLIDKQRYSPLPDAFMTYGPTGQMVHPRRSLNAFHADFTCCIMTPIIVTTPLHFGEKWLLLARATN
jgi:hypothetical protein